MKKSSFGLSTAALDSFGSRHTSYVWDWPLARNAPNKFPPPFATHRSTSMSGLTLKRQFTPIARIIIYGTRKTVVRRLVVKTSKAESFLFNLYFNYLSFCISIWGCVAANLTHFSQNVCWQRTHRALSIPSVVGSDGTHLRQVYTI